MKGKCDVMDILFYEYGPQCFVLWALSLNPLWFPEANMMDEGVDVKSLFLFFFPSGSAACMCRRFRMCPWIPAEGFLYRKAIWIHRGPADSEPYVVFIYYYCAKIRIVYVFVSFLPFIRKLFFCFVPKILDIAMIQSESPCINPMSLQTLLCFMY